MTDSVSGKNLNTSDDLARSQVIVLTSRADNVLSRIASCALAVLLVHRGGRAA